MSLGLVWQTGMFASASSNSDVGADAPFVIIAFHDAFHFDLMNTWGVHLLPSLLH